MVENASFIILVFRVLIMILLHKGLNFLFLISLDFLRFILTEINIFGINGRNTTNLDYPYTLIT